MMYPHIEINIDELADFLFIKNETNVIVELSLGGIEDNKDLFFFCLDLFCKGLVYLFGNDRSINIQSVTLDQFDAVKKKLENAGIRATLEIQQTIPCEIVHDDIEIPPDLPSSVLYPKVNVDELQLLPNTFPLKDYIFEIHLKETLVYKISFDLFHKTQ